MKKFKEIYHHPIFRVVSLLMIIWITASIGILYLEDSNVENAPSRIQDSFWWAIVTITTVGYGDYAPETFYGRGLAVILMLSGIGLVSTITGSISSIFTTKKIMQGKGLGMVESTNHIVVCGWNENIEHLLACMSQIVNKNQKEVVLINDLTEDQLNSILAKFSNLDIKFVRGDHSTESTLQLANIKDASSVIVISDDSIPEDDDKTILTTLTIKNLHPQLKVIAYVTERKKIPYLKRANADEVITDENFKSFLAATHVVEPGVPQAVNQLLDVHSRHRFKSEKIDERFIGKKFQELSEHYKNQNLLCIGIYVENIAMGYEELFSSADMLDEFIERKLKESGHGFKESNIDVILNPSKNFEIKEGQGALLII
tara:strand:+ start:1337 stop:2452 length:1116 start_codon:yes stop_codon:yes gene_type:complete